MFRKISIVLLLFCFVKISAQESNRFIEVTGTAKLSIEADQIEISIDTRTVKETLRKSKEANDAVLDELLNILDKFKSDPKDIQVSPLSFGINYKYEKNERVEDGYYTSARVDFKLTKIDSYFNLIDQLIRIEDISINNSIYKNSEYEKYNKTTYENAVKAAKQKAEYMANVAGQKLGKVIQITDNSSIGIVGMQQSYANVFNSSTTVNSNTDQLFGSIEIVRSVRVKYELTD